MSSLSKPHGGKRRRGAQNAGPQIPVGNVLTDSAKKDWKISSLIGRGGFGEIYTASDAHKPNQNNYVIKIEPSDNGPLFCEKTVYIRIGRSEDIKEYMKMKGLKSLGMPQFYGSGTHSLNGKKFRFLVMDRYGKDLWTIFSDLDRKFPPATVFKIAKQVLDVLEYMHFKGYVHADIKGANLLLGRNKGTENQVYLVDFGLAARYTSQYKPDPRRAHNGTIEYTSRDGHEGIVTRRGDIEVLGYNLVQWLSSNLPWEGSKDVHEVQASKIKHMKDCKILLQSCFKLKEPPKAIEKYFRYLDVMGPLEVPDYDKLKRYMQEGIDKTGDTGPKLNFGPSLSPSASKNRKMEDKVPKPRAAASRPRTNKTIQISDGSSTEEDIIPSTPEKVKRSWKDCPSVVSCAELLLKDDRALRRSKRNK